MTGLGLVGDRRQDSRFESLDPFGALAQRIDGGDDLGMPRVATADIAEPHLAAVEPDGGARHRHLAGAEGSAGARDAALHHDEPDLGATQDGIGRRRPERLPESAEPGAGRLREHGKPSLAARDRGVGRHGLLSKEAHHHGAALPFRGRGVKFV